MAKKYIQNMIDSIVNVVAANKDTICKLDPYKCSIQSYDEELLNSSPYINNMLIKKIITLQDTRTFIELKNKAQNYPGQTWKIGQKGFLVGPNHIECEVIKYDPATRNYTVLIEKTGGKFSITAGQFSLSPTKIEVDDSDKVDDFDNIDALNANEGEISQAPEGDDFEILNTPYGMDEAEENSVSANSVINQYNSGRMQTDGSDAEIVLKMKKTAGQEEEQNEDTFIIKKEGEVFAKEVSPDKVLKDTTDEINETFKKLNTPSTANNDEVKTVDYSKVPVDLKDWLMDFLNMEIRKQKVEIVDMTESEENIKKLKLIAEYAEESVANLAIDVLSKMKTPITKESKPEINNVEKKTKRAGRKKKQK